MIYKESEFVYGKTMAHWTVYYRRKSGGLANMTVDAKTEAEAGEIVKNKMRGFKDFERMADGTPIIKRMIYANEVYV